MPNSLPRPCQKPPEFSSRLSHGIQQIRQELPAARNPFTYYKRVIVSIDTLKNPERFRGFLRDHRWDAVVIDECQNVTNPGWQNFTLDRYGCAPFLLDPVQSVFVLRAGAALRETITDRQKRLADRPDGEAERRALDALDALASKAEHAEPKLDLLTSRLRRIGVGPGSPVPVVVLRGMPRCAGSRLNCRNAWSRQQGPGKVAHAV